MTSPYADPDAVYYFANTNISKIINIFQKASEQASARLDSAQQADYFNAAL